MVEKPKKKAVRRPLPQSLPREEFHVYPKDVDLANSTELAPEVTEVLERDPARWYVRQIIRHKYILNTAKVSSGAQTAVTAPMPLLPIPKSYAGATVLADIIIDKYVNHLPFYRQVKMFKQQGISLPESTVSGWFFEVANLMRPACWAHARRKFDEALLEDKARAGYALEQIGLLYDVERQADQENLDYEQRAQLRSRLSYPIMVAFEKWLVKEYSMVLPKGRIGKAIRYAYNMYNKLTRYHLD